MKAKGKTSIATVVLFDGSSSDACKIVMQHTDGSTGGVTSQAAITKDGTNCILDQGLRKMCETSGLKEIAEPMTIGVDCPPCNQHCNQGRWCPARKK